MRNFYRLATNLNIKPLMLAIQQKPQLWNQFTHRTQASIVRNGEEIQTPHREVDDIWLRMNPMEGCADRRESVDYPAYNELPEARDIIHALMNDVRGERIGRCMITRLGTGLRIYPHVDISEDLEIHYDNEQYYSRFHVVLQGLPGSLFNCGDETVCMQTGEVWWFDNAVEHEVINNSADERIHLVVDIRTRK